MGNLNVFCFAIFRIDNFRENMVFNNNSNDCNLGLTFLSGIGTLGNKVAFRCLLCGDEEWQVFDNHTKLKYITSEKYEKLVKDLKSKQSSRIKQFVKLDKEKYKYDLQRLGFVPESINMLLVDWHIMGSCDEDSKHKPENVILEMEHVYHWYQNKNHLFS